MYRVVEKRKRRKKIRRKRNNNKVPVVKGSFFDQLNFRQQKFVRLLLIDPSNPHKAAEAAGYRCGAASACSLLKNPKVQAAIQEEKERLVERIDVKQEQVVEELAKLAFFSIDKVLKYDGKKLTVKPFYELDSVTLAAIQDIKIADEGIVRLKSYDKFAALQALGRYFGIFNDKLDLNVGVKIKDVIEALPPELGERIRRALIERFSRRGSRALPAERKVVDISR